MARVTDGKTYPYGNAYCARYCFYQRQYCHYFSRLLSHRFQGRWRNNMLDHKSNNIFKVDQDIHSSSCAVNDKQTKV